MPSQPPKGHRELVIDVDRQVDSVRRLWNFSNTAAASRRLEAYFDALRSSTDFSNAVIVDCSYRQLSRHCTVDIKVTYTILLDGLSRPPGSMGHNLLVLG